MLRTKETETRNQLKMISIEELVPADHLLRKIDRVIDFEFINAEVKDLYSETGRPSIDPVVLVKLCVLNYLYGYNSMRRTIKECEVNMAHKWFIGYDLLEKVPHFTTFGKNYNYRFVGTDLFEKIFERILLKAIESKLVDTKTVFIDGTHVKANANTKKSYNKIVKVKAKDYAKELRREIALDREMHGKSMLKDDDNDNDGGKNAKTVKTETKNIKVSKTDPECGVFHKGEHKKVFAYNVQVASDRHGWVLGATVHKGNEHDSTVLKHIYKKIKHTIGKPEEVVVDAGYKTPYIAKKLIDDGVTPHMPYKRSATKKGFFHKNEYVYDQHFDCYLCPENQVLDYSTTNREGYREYKSNSQKCKDCPRLKSCTHSANHTKVVVRHIWQDYLDYAEDIRLTPHGKETYALRSQSIERVFADAKEKHGLRFTRHLGKKKVTTKILLTFSVMNLKKLAKLLGNSLLNLFHFFYFYPKKQFSY